MELGGCIGPGMAVVSKYTAVLEADGTPMSVRTTLQLINRHFSEDDFDADPRFCLHWFEERGLSPVRMGRYPDGATWSRIKRIGLMTLRSRREVAVSRRDVC